MAFEIKRNDRRPHYRVQLTENGDPADLSTAVAARVIMANSTGTVKIDRATMTFIDKPTGVVEYAWGATDTDTSGSYNLEVEIDWGGSEYQTFPSKGYFVVTISDDLG